MSREAAHVILVSVILNTLGVYGAVSMFITPFWPLMLLAGFVASLMIAGFALFFWVEMAKPFGFFLVEMYRAAHQNLSKGQSQ